MSRFYPPRFTEADHGDPVVTVLGKEYANTVKAQFKEGTPEMQMAWVEYYDTMVTGSDKLLSAIDEYAKVVSEDLWKSTSVYSGNTRGSLKIVGTYPAIDIEFDKEEWFKPKVLMNLTERVVHSRWMTKHGWHEQTYVYDPGTKKVKITGRDYAPRIPSPPHGGGNIDMLIAVYDELKTVAFKKILKKVGL